MTLENIYKNTLLKTKSFTVLKKNSEEFYLEDVFNSLRKNKLTQVSYRSLLVEQTQEDMVELLLDWYYPTKVLQSIWDCLNESYQRRSY